MGKLLTLSMGALVLVSAAPAHALNQSVHYQIAYDSCIEHGGPDAFCEQVAVADHNVDNQEFNILAAHGQMEYGQTACDGANTAIWRVFWFGQQIRHSIEGIVYQSSRAKITALASFLGRSLHVVQDNCAHSGMTNQQHAWKSLDDVCQGTNESPDAVPAAATCARQETDAVMDAVFETLSDWGAEKWVLSNISESHNRLTNYIDACNYLGEAGDWDGVDRRWDNNIVRPYMRNEIVQAITNDKARHGWVCNSAPDGLLVGYDWDVDTSNGANKCFWISAVCLGKADEVGATPNESLPQPPSTTQSSGGCSVGGADTAVDFPMMLSLLAIGFALRGPLRQRRRS